MQPYKEALKRGELPHIPALETFLSTWKTQADAWYRERTEALFAYEAQYRSKRNEICAKYAPREFQHQKEIRATYKAAGVDRDTYTRQKNRLFSKDVQRLAMNGQPGTPDYEAALETLLTAEVQSKRLDLFSRCTAAVGVITDAKDLHIGPNGSLNGLVIGENGKAFIESIIAGGHTVQCLHCRVLVKPVYEKAPLQDKILSAKAQEGQNAKRSGENHEPDHTL